MSVIIEGLSENAIKDGLAITRNHAWNKMVWIDESTFHLNQNDGKEKVWRTARTPDTKHTASSD